MDEKSQSILKAISERRFQHQQALRKQTAPKREPADQLLFKLTKDDKELERLIKKAHDTSRTIVDELIAYVHSVELGTMGIKAKINPSPGPKVAGTTLQLEDIKSPW